jgi:hypothetical protein
VSTVTERTESKKRLVTVKFYITKEELIEYEKHALFMYKEKVIPRPTVGAFAKAAGYKWFNEINKKLTSTEATSKREKTLPKTSVEENRDTTNYGLANP